MILNIIACRIFEDELLHLIIKDHDVNEIYVFDNEEFHYSFDKKLQKYHIIYHCYSNLNQLKEILIHKKTSQGIILLLKLMELQLHIEPDLLKKTIYKELKEIEIQTNEELHIENFTPSLMPNAHCGVTCLCLVNEQKLIPLTNVSNSLNQNDQKKIDVASRTKKSVINRWKNKSKENSFDVISSCCNRTTTIDKNSLNWFDFVNLNENNYLTISIMAFQDSLNYEIDRVKNCCIHVITKDHLMIPFCNYNLSSFNCEKYLYRS